MALILAWAAVWAPARPLVAQSPIGPAFRVNSPSVGSQDQPDLLFDGDGNLWFTWVDSLGAFPDFDRVVARRVSVGGELGPELVLVDTSDAPLTTAVDPLLTLRPDGGLQLFYTRSTEDGFDLVYGQRLRPTGETLGQRFLVTPPSPSNALRFAAASRPDGGVFLVTLGSPCSTCPQPRTSLYGRIIAADGSLASSFFRIPSKLSGVPGSGTRSVAVDRSGNALVVWSIGNGDPDSRDYSDIRARRFSSAGVPLGQEFVVNTTLQGTQADASVAANATGDFVVVWQTRFPNSLLRSIFGQRFSKTGQKVGAEFRVNEDRIEKDFLPTVAMDPDGNFVVAWESFSPERPDCMQVRGRLYRRNGTSVGPEFPAAPGGAACGEAPKVAFGPDGRFAIVWQVELGSSSDTGADFDVYAARFSVSPP